MKRIFLYLFFILGLLLLFSVSTGAQRVYEFSLSEGEDAAESAIDKFIDSIPDEIKDELPKNEKIKDFQSYDASYFADAFRKGINDALEPALGTVSVLVGAVIISGAFSLFADTVCQSSLKSAFSFLSSLCVSLYIFDGMRRVFDTVESLLKVLSDTMLAVIPMMEAVYIGGGNLTSAAVTSSGVSLMIGFTEALFSKVLEPAVYTLFILSVISAITKNPCIGFLTKSAKGLLGASVLIIMTLMSFVLSMQSSAGAAQDSFVQKTVRFAVGNYIPIVGGTVADSFSVFSGSIGVIKQNCSVVAIAAMIVAFLPPFCVVLAGELAVGMAGSVSGMLGCERESALLSECKSICNLLLAICVGAVVMYIIAIGIFCKTPLAMG